MNIFVYDGTFEGLLTSIFESCELGLEPNKIERSDKRQASLFSNDIKVATKTDKAKRVWYALKKKTSGKTCQKVYRAFLSEVNDVEIIIYKFILYCLRGPKDAEMNFGNENVLQIDQLSRRVGREAHYAIMFIRMQETEGGFYAARFEPKYDIFPLIIKHFTDRYRNQKWLLYDTKRNYGYLYDSVKTNRVELQDSRFKNNNSAWKVNAGSEERAFQNMWAEYCNSVTIEERKNPKLQMQHMPKRFWKYLPEKNSML